MGTCPHIVYLGLLATLLTTTASMANADFCVAVLGDADAVGELDRIVRQTQNSEPPEEQALRTAYGKLHRSRWFHVYRRLVPDSSSLWNLFYPRAFAKYERLAEDHPELAESVEQNVRRGSYGSPRQREILELAMKNNQYFAAFVRDQKSFIKDLKELSARIPFIKSPLSSIRKELAYAQGNGGRLRSQAISRIAEHVGEIAGESGVLMKFAGKWSPERFGLLSHADSPIPFQISQANEALKTFHTSSLYKNGSDPARQMEPNILPTLEEALRMANTLKGQVDRLIDTSTDLPAYMADILAAESTKHDNETLTFDLSKSE